MTRYDLPGIVARAAVGTILLVTLASGPGGLAFTEERVTALDATPGNATVAEVRFPDRVTLRYEGEGRYGLAAEPAVVTFERITGGDVQVTYGLSVDSLNVSEATTTVTDGSGGLSVSIALSTLVEGEAPTASRYEGTVFVSLISRGETELVAKRTLRVRVSNGTA